jgi:hypothetical protein
MAVDVGIAVAAMLLASAMLTAAVRVLRLADWLSMLVIMPFGMVIMHSELAPSVAEVAVNCNEALFDPESRP